MAVFSGVMIQAMQRGDEIGQLAVAFERMRRQLAQLDDARRAFIANASHELRTPLFSLGGFLELLDAEDLDEPTRREFLEEARSQLVRLQKLAVDLLDLSRLDAGKLRVEREPVELERLADAVVREFAPRAARGGHVLEVEGDEAPALADAERVAQIARILVDNALVHTPVGTAVVVRTTSRDDVVELAVEDDGPGIATRGSAEPPEDLDSPLSPHFSTASRRRSRLV